MKRRSTHYKKGCEHHDIGDERRPKRKHVQDGEGHVGRADLYGQEIVAEAALGRGSQHEKHHDRAVHGYQGEIGFGFDLAHQRQDRRRPDEMDPHQQGEKHADENRGEREEIILQPDDLVVETKNPFANEALRGRMLVRFLGNHFIVSPPPELPATCQTRPG